METIRSAVYSRENDTSAADGVGGRAGCDEEGVVNLRISEARPQGDRLTNFFHVAGHFDATYAERCRHSRGQTILIVARIQCKAMNFSKFEPCYRVRTEFPSRRPRTSCPSGANPFVERPVPELHPTHL